MIVGLLVGGLAGGVAYLWLGVGGWAALLVWLLTANLVALLVLLLRGRR